MHMKKNILKVLKVLLVIFVAVWFVLFLSRKVDLTTADLGRHIENGKILVHGSTEDKLVLLSTNFYSYTMPEQPFVNHHWLSGVLFYGLYALFGFSGLSVFYLLFGVLTLAIFFKLAAEKAGVVFTSFVSILLTPLSASRTEVRPEILTYFFTAVFFYVLYKFGAEPQKKWVWVLPFLMLLWINLHIGFVFGFLLLGAFFLENFIKGFVLKQSEQIKKTRTLFFVGLVSFLAAVLNPHFLKGVLYPLNIFKNYGYLIVENQSIKFLENLNITAGQNFLLFKIAAGTVFLSFVLVYAVKRKFALALFLVTLVAGVLAYKGIRHFPSFAFFASFCLSVNLAEFYKAMKQKTGAFSFIDAAVMPVLVFILAVSLNSGLNFLKQKASLLGLGVLPGSLASAEFFKSQNLEGPVFNDYDIGGYLVYAVPKEKVFVDNRPEAYTVDFFENVYKPMQTNEEKWQEALKKYNFNAIFFSHRDYTSWAQSFLISRVQDPTWAPVFVDGYNIIFLKRTEENKLLIEKFEIPKSRFGLK